MNPSFGSGTNLLGAPASSVMGMPGGLQQQTPSSASFEPGLMPPPPGQAPQGPPQGMPPQQPMQPQMPQQQGTVGMPPGPSETEMILKALISRLGVHSKHEEAVRNAILPPQPSQGGLA